MRYEKLGYMALNVTDLARSAAFYRDIVGLQTVPSQEAGPQFLRCGGEHHHVVLYQGAQPGLKRVGVEMQDAAALDEIAQRLMREGLHVHEVSAEECARLHQGRSLRFVDPHTEATFEFYSTMRAFGGQPFVPTHTKIQRLGHLVLKTARFAEALQFYTGVLDLAVSDAIGDAVCFMRFHPNPYHHGIGLAKATGPLLHHVNFMVTEVDDIGKALGRFRRHEVIIVNGPGRHPASGSMYLYFLDPDGLTLEYSFGMEEFPPQGARKPRVFEPIPESYDYWGSYTDARRYTVGAVEALDTASLTRLEAS